MLEKLDAHRYHLAAHDVGAWVAYPYAALFGGEVLNLALLDAGIPGITLPVAPARAWRTWHFAFHAIPDLPELLIAGKERAYLDLFLRRKTANPQTFTEADIDESLRIHEGRRIACGTGLLSCGRCFCAPESCVEHTRQIADACSRSERRSGLDSDMAGPLRDYADDVRGVTIAHCGHFLPEEQPAAVSEELRNFFG